MLRVSAALSRPGIELVRGHFGTVLGEARAGDFIYFDPLRAPDAHGAIHVRLAARTPGITARGHRFGPPGCHVLLSHTTAPVIAELYEDDPRARRAGLRACRIAARRAINSKGGRRGPVCEYLISNVTPRPQ